MDLDQLLLKRRSIRAFKHKSVSSALLDSVIKAASLAPSAGNLQAYEIYIVRSKEKLEELEHAAFEQESISGAPVCLVFCANPERSALEYGKRGREMYSLQDATIAATFAVLKIFELGLGTVWIGAFDDREVKKVIGSEINRPIAILPVGFPDENPEMTARRERDDFIHEVR